MLGRDNAFSNRIKNLITIQSAYGAGSHAAFKLYIKLSENKLLDSDMNSIISSGILSKAEYAKLSSYQGTDAICIVNECAQVGINILGISDDKYPERLRNIPTPPLVLYIKGDLPDIDNEPTFCIVGPRKVSEFGAKAAYSLGLRLARSGMIVVSGGALGCDTFAHKGALKCGKTIAVLGCGILCDYLPENRELRRQISENGCIISEFPPHIKGSRYSFPIRNRILSGLSLGTAVIEAGVKSGALITAKHANDQGRDVFVIPGNPTLEHYKGSNALLRDGALPLIDASDIFNVYLPLFPEKIDIEKAFARIEENKNNRKISKKFDKGLSKEAKIVYNYLDKQKFTADDLLELEISDDELLSALTELELEGYIRALPGGIYIMV